VSEPATTADIDAMKTEIIEAVKDTVTGLATQETASAVRETAAETKAGVTELKGLMKDNAKRAHCHARGCALPEAQRGHAHTK
jgi:hypothetical protein